MKYQTKLVAEAYKVFDALLDHTGRSLSSCPESSSEWLLSGRATRQWRARCCPNLHHGEHLLPHACLQSSQLSKVDHSIISSLQLSSLEAVSSISVSRHNSAERDLVTVDYWLRAKLQGCTKEAMRQHQVGANYEEREAGSLCCKAEQYAESQLEESKPRSINHRADLGSEDPNEGVGVVAGLMESRHRAWNLQLTLGQLKVAEGRGLQLFRATNLELRNHYCLQGKELGTINDAHLQYGLSARPTSLVHKSEDDGVVLAKLQHRRLLVSEHRS